MIHIGDYVIINLEGIEYEGILLEVSLDEQRVIIYCPDFDEVSPYIVTDAKYLKASTRQDATKLIN